MEAAAGTSYPGRTVGARRAGQEQILATTPTRRVVPLLPEDPPMDLPAALHRAWQWAATPVLGPGVAVSLMTLSRGLAITTIACTVAVPAVLLVLRAGSGCPLTARAVAPWVPFPALTVLACDGYGALLGDHPAALVVAPTIGLGCALTWWASRSVESAPSLSWSDEDDILWSTWAAGWRGDDAAA
jgi:hypothetical protein